MDFLPQYDELWVISDIHMGGERSVGRNFQIFRRGARLANFIHYLTSQRQEEDVALVLNGDIIDSLAEDTVPSYVALDAETALRMMDHLYTDPSFACVWDALGKFVRTQKRHLVLVVGNHDIEFALGPVEAFLRQRLAGDDPAAQARLVFSTHGGGFGCRVGAKRVFCTHGNEVDEWNIVDYSELGALNNAINAGRRVDALRWTPNAGTRMVIDIMNKVKERYPFVDLLKPENKPVLSVLLTLDPGLVKQIDLGASFHVIRNLISGNQDVKNLLSAGTALERVSTSTVAAAAVTELLGPSLAQQVRSAQPGASEDELLLAAERDLAKGAAASAATLTPAAAVTPEVATLGWVDIFAGAIGLVDPVEALRQSLRDWLGQDTTFDLSTRDGTFNAIVDRVGPGIDFIVTGHTHLARSIPYAPGRHYFNCGTWIRLLRLTPQVMDDANVFKEHFYDVLAERTMDAIDDASIPGPNGTTVPLVLDRTNAVRISRNGSDVTGALLRVVDDRGKNTVNIQTEIGGLGE